MADLLRYIALLESLLVIGATGALYERIGRFDLPVKSMRTIFAGLILMNTIAVADIYDRLHDGPLTWRTPAVIVSMTLYIGGLVSLWWHYRGPRDPRLQDALRFVERGLIRHTESAHPRGARDGGRKPTGPPPKPPDSLSSVTPSR